MQRPLLLVPAGESLRTPELERAFAEGGWDVDWSLEIPSLEAKASGSTSTLILVDPAAVGPAGIQAVRAFRGLHPELPVVLLVEGSGGGPLAVGGAESLVRSTPEIHWPGILHGFLPRDFAGQKLTSEDIFGDILAEIDAPQPRALLPAPVPTPPPIAATPAPVIATPPTSVPPVAETAKPTVVQVPISRPVVNQTSIPKPASRSTTTIQATPVRPPVVKTVPAESKAEKVERSAKSEQLATAPIPVPSFASMGTNPAVPEDRPGVRPDERREERIEAPAASPSPILPELFGDILGPLAEAPAKADTAKPGSDFTLSGFSGIHDLFGDGAKDAAPRPATVPAPSTASPIPVPERPSKPAIEKSASEKPALLSEPDSKVGSLELEFLEAGGSTPPESRSAKPAAQAPRPSATPDLDPSLMGESPLEEFGNYYLLEKIAVGGMAELFKARQRGVHNFEKIVAIKRILPHLSDNDEFVRMFIDEAKLAAQLTHPNIVQIFDLGKASGFYYIAMEYVDGKDLRSMLRKVREYRHPLPEPIAAYVTMKVAMALDYAHRKRGMNDKELKLVHRDVSPQNVLISSEGAVKLVDFGIAKAATKSTQTMAGALKGKLLYMSPEQALGSNLDNRSDIYSLGLVLFELLTGERCFQADSELGVLEKVRMGKVQDVRSVNPSVSQGMAQILEKALQKNVDQRYHSARLMERDLKSLLVQNGNEPGDHEVADYVNTLLKGTKDQLELMLMERFPVRVAPAPSKPPTAAPASAPAAATSAPRKMDEQPTMAGSVKTSVTSSLPIPLPPPELSTESRGGRRWLIPVLLGLAALGGLAFWLLRH